MKLPPPFDHIDADDCKGVAEFTIVAAHHGPMSVAVKGSKFGGDGEPEFIYWMGACEQFMNIVAQKSPAGYEKALEALVQGAMTYRRKKVE